MDKNKAEARNLKELIDELNKDKKDKPDNDFSEVEDLFRECGLDELLED